MSNNRKLKELAVKKIESQIEESSSLAIATYHHLSVTDLYELRTSAREQGVKIIVFKNRLVKIAANNTGYNKLADFLVGPNLFAFGGEDEMAPSKILANFAKTHKKMELVAGIYEKKVIDSDELKLVASLPNYEEALTMLAASLQDALKQVSVGLKMLVDENHISK